MEDLLSSLRMLSKLSTRYSELTALRVLKSTDINSKETLWIVLISPELSTLIKSKLN